VARLASVTLEGFKDVNAKINALVDSQIRTDANLRNLVAVVDRCFSEGVTAGNVSISSLIPRRNPTTCCSGVRDSAALQVLLAAQIER
jgi:hypothetical protein